jgi:hypothetical protein
MQTGGRQPAQFDMNMLRFLDASTPNVYDLPFLHGGLLSLVSTARTIDVKQDNSLTLSESLAKKTAPLPTPRVPFFFLPFLSISQTDQVLISSAVALVEATRSAGSTYVLTGL